MIVMSSALPPAPRGWGIRSVPAVTGPARQTLGSQQPKSAARGLELERADRSESARIDGEAFIDAEFVEVLREAASAATAMIPADGSTREALEAYRAAGQQPSILGAMIDMAT